MIYAVRNKANPTTDKCIKCANSERKLDRTVTCPDCGSKRVASASVASMYRKGKKLGLCTPCKNKRAKLTNSGQIKKGNVPWNKGINPNQKEDRRLYKLQWREANRDKVNEYFRDYYYKNHEAGKLARRLSRAKRRAVGEISRAIAQELLEKSLGRCYICNSEFGDKWEIDHITPIKFGGDNSLNNLAIACRSCNRKKSTKSLGQYLKDSGGSVNNLY